MKLSVIYDSRTGNTKRCAEWIAEGMGRVAGVEAKTFSTKDVDEAFVKDSAGVVIGSPSYYALMTADMRTWLLEGAPKLSLGGKLGGAFATVQYTHGGLRRSLHPSGACRGQPQRGNSLFGRFSGEFPDFRGKIRKKSEGIVWIGSIKGI